MSLLPDIIVSAIITVLALCLIVGQHYKFQQDVWSIQNKRRRYGDDTD